MKAGAEPFGSPSGHRRAGAVLDRDGAAMRLAILFGDGEPRPEFWPKPLMRAVGI